MGNPPQIHAGGHRKRTHRPGGLSRLDLPLLSGRLGAGRGGGGVARPAQCRDPGGRRARGPARHLLALSRGAGRRHPAVPGRRQQAQPRRGRSRGCLACIGQGSPRLRVQPPALRPFLQSACGALRGAGAGAAGPGPGSLRIQPQRHLQRRRDLSAQAPPTPARAAQRLADPRSHLGMWRAPPRPLHKGYLRHRMASRAGALPAAVSPCFGAATTSQASSRRPRRGGFGGRWGAGCAACTRAWAGGWG